MTFENKLYGLAYGCPYIERNYNCPFKEFDKLSVKEKVDMIDDLGEDKKRKIWEHHLICNQISEKVKTQLV